MVSARASATSSGITTQPPRKLKPCRTGTSQWNGAPATIAVSVGSTISITSPVRNTGKVLPVASCRAFAQRHITTQAAMARITATMNGPSPSLATGAGICRPRLLTKNSPPKLMLCRGPGSGPSTAKYQKKICSSGGMLRNTSM
ncbi:hypothetical protein D3C76_1315670 [compost metagenome]